VFLNDATSEDGAQEYGALKVTGEGRFVQVESITFSWCSQERALEHIGAVIGGKYDRDAGRELELSVQESRLHGRCSHCA
jgi:hypothetical protein